MRRRTIQFLIVLSCFVCFTRFVNASWPVDYNDERILVGSAHNVFVAKVLKEEGASPIDHPIPHTRFRVLVVHNIKGHLNGEVFIDQGGGYKNGEFMVVDTDVVHTGKKEESGLLVPGSTYLLATRSHAVNPEKKHLLMGAPKAKVLISSDSELPIAEMRQEALKHEKVLALQKAYENEVIPKILERDARNRFSPKPGTLPNDL